MIVRSKVDFSKPPQLTPEQIEELKALEAMDDSEIDFSDIPEMTDEDWKHTARAKDILNGNFVNIYGELLPRLDAEKLLNLNSRMYGLSPEEYARLYAKLPPEDKKAAGA